MKPLRTLLVRTLQVSVFSSILTTGLVTALFPSSLSIPLAHADNESPFLPTWKHLSTDEKKQFIAGYIFGWKDAAQVTAIATEFIKSNPQKAVESLQSVERIYSMSELDPAQVAKAIDLFFSMPENSGAPLSKAVTAARQGLGG